MEDDDDFLDNDREQMLADTIAKARKLVAEMERQQREMAESPPPHHQDLPPEQLAEFQRDKQACIMDRPLAKKLGLNIGDRVPLRARRPGLMLQAKQDNSGVLCSDVAAGRRLALAAKA